MANDFEVAVEVAVSPGAAWALVGDPARVAEWFGAVTACEVSGDVRRVTTAQGGVLVERLTARDDTARTYSYSVVEGIPALTAHSATFCVTPATGGCRIAWRQTGTSDQEGYDLERRLSGVMRAGLERARGLLEGAPTA